MMLKLQFYGEKVLRTKCKEVTKVDGEIRRFVEDLSESMMIYNGSGLAAPQVGRDLRIFVICLIGTDKRGGPVYGEPVVYINPVITRFSEEKRYLSEGCLSIPGYWANILRPSKIDIQALDIHGNPFEEKDVHGWRARVLQHESDHINGVLMVDHLDKKAHRKVKPLLDEIEKQHSHPTKVIGRQEFSDYFS